MFIFFSQAHQGFHIDYRSHNNVGRVLYRVGTLRSIANDLLRILIIKTLIEYFNKGRQSR